MWTSTTCGDFPDTALYFAFGKAYDINLITGGPGAMRNDYKYTTGVAIQAPKLSIEFWEKLYGEEYPYQFDPEDTITLFDLSASENAADYIVIYNHALLVRNVK